MIVKQIPASWLVDENRRLDCGPFVKGSVETRKLIESLTLLKDKLDSLTIDNGIYHVGQEKLKRVNDIKYGIPFLRSTDVLKVDNTRQPLIAKEQVEKNKLFLAPEGTTLITRSGTIGRMAFLKSDMAQMAMSQDILKVVPDTNLILSGYLYTFLRSKFGIPLVLGGTFGSIIVHIEAENIADLPVPRLGETIEREIHSGVIKAAENRVLANELLNRNATKFNNLLNSSVDATCKNFNVTSFKVFEVNSNVLCRLDATHHTPVGTNAVEQLKSSKFESRCLGDIADVFTPGIFKRPYVDEPEYGYPYYSGSELFLTSPNPRGYLRKLAKNIDKYVVKENWLLIQDAGQLGGLIGRVVRVGKSIENSVVSNHLMRVKAKSEIDAAYIFTVLTSEIGYKSIVRNAFGTSIPQLDPKHISEIKIPWPEENIRRDIAKDTLRAWELQDEAIVSENTSLTLLEKSIEAAAPKH